MPRPFPDYESTGLHYFPMNKTLVANRIIDDFHPRVQSKKACVLGECTLDNANKILEFGKKSEECIRGNLEHLKLLGLKKEKRKKERAEKKLPRQGRNMKILIGLPCLKMVL